MAETLTIRTASSTEVIKIVEAGPQGPAGPAGTGLETLTTQGDMLYRGASAGERLPIGSAGQVLKVNSGATAPEWGAASAVDLTAPGPIGSVAPNTGAFTTLSATGTATLPNINGSLAGNLYIHVKNVSGGELARGTPVYIVGNVGDTDRVEVAAADFDDAAKMPAVGLLDQTLANNGSGDAIILGELDEANTNSYTINQELFVGNNGALTTTRPTTGQVQSVGTVARVNSNTGVIVVNMQGQRSPNETFAAASHTHGNLTNDGKIGTTANLPLKTGTNGVIEAGSFGTSAGSFCEGNDARLSDTRDPNAHAASHLPNGADELFDQSLNTGDSVEFASVTTATFIVGELFVGESGISFDGDAVIAAGRLYRSDDIGSQATVLACDTNGDWSVDSPDNLRTAISAAASGSITTSGLTQSTARILGRTTASTGAVEEITIGSGLLLSAGELSSTVSAGIPATLLDAKGDLIVASAADTAARLPVGGTNGHVLTVDSAEALGLKYAALPAGGATNLWIPASAWIPKTTAGCGVDSRETTTNDQNFDELLFDTGSDEFADALVIMPSNYNNGTITARFYWTAASGSGGVAWAIQGRAFANDDALDTAAGTAQLVTDTLIAANDMHVTSATSAVTIGGTPAANTPIQFTIYRDVSDAGDDLAVDARLLGVEILFN